MTSPSEVGRDIGRAASALAERGIARPAVAVVLGSGLSSFADGVGDAVVAPYAEIPGFPHTAVVGHRVWECTIS